MYWNDNPHKIKNYVIIYLCNSKPVCISFLCRNVCIQIVPIDLICFFYFSYNGRQWEPKLFGSQHSSKWLPSYSKDKKKTIMKVTHVKQELQYIISSPTIKFVKQTCIEKAVHTKIKNIVIIHLNRCKHICISFRCRTQKVFWRMLVTKQF